MASRYHIPNANKTCLVCRTQRYCLPTSMGREPPLWILFNLWLTFITQRSEWRRALARAEKHLREVHLSLGGCCTIWANMRDQREKYVFSKGIFEELNHQACDYDKSVLRQCSMDRKVFRKQSTHTMHIVDPNSVDAADLA